MKSARLLVLLAALAGGCEVPYMTAVEPPQPLKPPPNTGLVVFVATPAKTPMWANRDDWVRSTRQMRVDPNGQQLFAGRDADVAERLRRAREHLQKYAGTPEQDKHFIAQNDGI